MASHVGPSVPLTPETSRLLQDLVDSGRFASPAEAVHGALLLLRDAPLDDVDDLAELREDVNAGLAQLDAGLGQPWDAEQVKARLRARAGNAAGSAG